MLAKKWWSLLEKRQHKRFRLRLSVFGVGANGTFEMIGTTANLSRSGVLVCWESSPQPQLKQELCLYLQLPVENGPARFLQCYGTVVRIDGAAADRTLHVALSLMKMKFAAAPRQIALRMVRRRSRTSPPGNSLLEVALIAVSRLSFTGTL